VPPAVADPAVDVERLILQLIATLEGMVVLMVVVAQAVLLIWEAVAVAVHWHT
jgi:hypothetical protein